MEIEDATLALSALGQSTRLSVFRLLVEAGPEGVPAGGIAGALSLPGATLSFHLKELSAAGLVEGEQRGRSIRYRARFETMNALIEFLTRNCCGGDTSRCAPREKSC
ncbi:ArsR/SmtB family transcription factor [Marilutibacter chinensis]|uniref:Metalloregulator ArsR/SmtB family transcription factor n=1 Tax=Marilutibacter chinensis TaxID=2912247 RepID=A0ABS9HPT9_9GAMM|nr:metalloregulator ArsR/SmtB family transcription factor [Lysobacter chinensis]MCF7220966.1 metalloregulator ArsR/SmtB family transcription factor [Lysobacter chinensis]